MAYEDLLQPEVADSYILVMADKADKDEKQASFKSVQDATGIQLASSSDFGNSTSTAEAVADAGGVYFDEFDICVVTAKEDQVSNLSALQGRGDVLAMEPDVMMYALGSMPNADYFRGLQHGISQGSEAAIGKIQAEMAAAAPQAPSSAPAPTAASFTDGSEATWGIEAIGADQSQYSGKGIKLAVLDTGFDLKHPDFAGRKIVSQSFVANEPVQDGAGHGTHCIGTACGPLKASGHPRYGVAPEADIYVGKVLSNKGSGSSSGIINGIRWALTNGCDVISMSLGSPTRVGDRYYQAYERVAQRALAKNALIIAAAGNESYRPNRIAPVGSPANCPSIMAVGAVDSMLGVAYFSCGGIDTQQGMQVDIAGPGVDVFSSWPMPKKYNSISGTSMATPHVAGVAALYCQSDNSLRGQRLWHEMQRKSQPLYVPARDVGAGLVKVP